MILSLMSIVYHTEGANSMNIKILEGKTKYVSKYRDRMKKFVIIFYHDRINNVPMIKVQEGYQMNIKAQKEEAHCKSHRDR
jgi:hypothetical protein